MANKATANDVFELLQKVNKEKSSHLSIKLFSDGSGHILSSSGEEKSTFYSLDRAIIRLNELLNPIIEIALNSDYTAEISNTGITVGCQSFSFDVLDKLVEASKTFRSPSRAGQKVTFNDMRIGEKGYFRGVSGDVTYDTAVYTKTGFGEITSKHKIPYNCPDAIFELVA